MAHKGHRKLFYSLQIHFVSRQAHFVSRQLHSQLHSVLHGTLSYFTAHFLTSRHTFLLHGTLSFFHGTLSFLTAHFLSFTAHFLSSRHTYYFTAHFITLRKNCTSSFKTIGFRGIFADFSCNQKDFSQSFTSVIGKGGATGWPCPPRCLQFGIHSLAKTT